MGLRTSTRSDAPTPTNIETGEGGLDREVYAEVSNAVNTVVQALSHGLVSSTQIELLVRQLKNKYSFTEELFPARATEIADPGYGPGFDLQGEFNNQIRTIRALQAKIQNPNGSLRDSISPREAKELITAGNTMLTSLLKHHKDVMSMERQRAIESAVIETVKTLNEPSRDLFYKVLEDVLPKKD